MMLMGELYHGLKQFSLSITKYFTFQVPPDLHQHDMNSVYHMSKPDKTLNLLALYEGIASKLPPVIHLSQFENNWTKRVQGTGSKSPMRSRNPNRTLNWDKGVYCLFYTWDTV